MVSEAQRKRMEDNKAAALARLSTKTHLQNSAVHNISETGPLMQYPQKSSNFGQEAHTMFAHKRIHEENQAIQSCLEESHNLFPSNNTLLSHRAYTAEAERRYPSCKKVQTRSTDSAISDEKAPSLKIVSSPFASDFAKLTSKRIEISLELLSWNQIVVRIQDQDISKYFFHWLSNLISPVPTQSMESSAVYDIKEYESVLQALREIPSVVLGKLPQSTLSIIQRMVRLNYSQERWIPFMPIHVPDTVVDELMLQIPPKLRSILLPFQIEGVKYGLRRGGRCLIADEMGIGKTIQAIALAACYENEGSILITCPASLRLMWAEELEKWLPFLLPIDIHLVFGRKNNLADNAKTPKVVVISYTMLKRLRKNMMRHKWAVLIVDESHNLRCTRNKVECEETTTILDIAQNIRRIVLLSGTPSLSRPYDIFHQINMLSPCLLGRNKYDFAQNYCSTESLQQSQPVWTKDFSKGKRLHELNILLRETVMIRRLKDDVLAQLPPKRRQIIRLTLEAADVMEAKSHVEKRNSEELQPCICGFSFKGCCDCDCEDVEDDVDSASTVNMAHQGKSTKYRAPLTLSYQEIGLAKLRGVREWLSNHPLLSHPDKDILGRKDVPKMIIFAHHIKVLDSIQEMVHGKCLEYVRIDGSTMASDRQKAVDAFRCKDEVRIAIIGLTAGGVGLNFSSAQSVVFAELPKSTSDLLQAEDRAHRYGQCNAVNIYFFCAKDTTDEMQWQSLSKSMERVSTMTNGSENAVTEIKVNAVLDASTIGNNGKDTNSNTLNQENGMIISFSDSLVPPRTLKVLEPRILLNCENERKITDPREDSGVILPLENNMATTLVQEDKESNLFPDCLMFEVSSNTGRIHLYGRSMENGYRPTPLGDNFLPEDLETAKGLPSVRHCTSLPACLKENSKNFDLSVSFIKEWNSLRPVQRNCLLGRPLQIPLALELELSKVEGPYLQGGLLKGGSKRRVIPSSEIDANLPEGAAWKEITLRQNSFKERLVKQAWTTAGEPLCKLCFKQCLKSCSKTPEYFEDLFCDNECYQNYRLKTSQTYLRQELFLLEKGVCTICKLDCHALIKKIRPLSLEKRREYTLQKAPEFKIYTCLLERLVSDPKEGNAWHADHIVPVFQGGGECNLHNVRTLCVICHAKVTAEQSQKRRKSFARAKQGFQVTIEKFIENWCKKRMRTFESEDGNVAHAELSDNETDHDILSIHITGSVYSRKDSTSNACNEDNE